MATVKDPICGKDVDTLRARAVGIFGGQTFYFCSQECKSKYVDPRKTPREREDTKPLPLKPKIEAKPKVEAKPQPKPEPQKAEPKPEPALPPIKVERKDPSLEELPPMPTEPAGGDLDLPDLTPSEPRKRSHSPSVIAEIQDLKKDSRRWAFIIVILAALVVAAVVLSLRN
jgi:YHS domain-containing protein